METDLFADEEQFQRLPLPGADIQFLRTLALPAPADDILRELVAASRWEARDRVMWGKPVAQPRLTAWHSDVFHRYDRALRVNPWTPLLLNLKARVEAVTGECFNSVLLNYYRDENDSVAMHSDDEQELGPRPPIASLSLGETRTFVMKHRHLRALKPVRIDLPSGCLLLMRGETQRNWLHGIDKENRPLGPRVNLTFRQIRVFSAPPPNARPAGA